MSKEELSPDEAEALIREIAGSESIDAYGNWAVTYETVDGDSYDISRVDYEDGSQDLEWDEVDDRSLWQKLIDGGSELVNSYLGEGEGEAYVYEEVLEEAMF